MTPEATLIEMKEVIGEVNRAPVDPPLGIDDDVERELISDVVDWCIAEYYGDDHQ